MLDCFDEADDAVSEIQEESNFRHQYSLKSEADEENGDAIEIGGSRSSQQMSTLSVDQIDIDMGCQVGHIMA